MSADDIKPGDVLSYPTGHQCPDRDGEHKYDAECTCTYFCGEDEAAGCCYCTHSDIYQPCPAIGFGCADDAGACGDCCSPEQARRAAIGYGYLLPMSPHPVGPATDIDTFFGATT